MEGPFTFLPVNTNSNLKARVQQKVGTHEWKDKMIPNRPTTAEEHADGKDDDEWYDTVSASSEEAHHHHTPLKKTKRLNKADVNQSLVSVKSISPEEEQELLPYMPALFGTDLPPCGLEPQVAYEIVVARLRERWLNAKGRRGVIDICQELRELLRDQEHLWPPFMLKGVMKKRKPWRREPVFKYELYWADYFVREANEQAPALMTESELMDRRMQSAVPFELKFNVDRSDLLKLWEDWNNKKRAKTPALPGIDEETVVEGQHAADETIERVKSGNSEGSDSAPKSVDSSQATIVHHPGPQGAPPPEDAYLWSQGGHD
ncbi:hypothetical protein BU24DRAFT_411944 [Aaosphaeria arxii CBS 175.79]|uniref:Uncharacterized protein n=1 Tax=Aaosphaeria arxii CBS 175.79 TaxID=1450172 RepID=A0A6A5XIA3_9PLEO|nr:uncharacterized protein BU24DRAFT_411944 [Aaosphaeria arxii CBS 175.79]KAF2012596.1 hypothetical protein BU24DRAFT_411944 [Aaosphaeria arxii CBS 175.79]